MIIVSGKSVRNLIITLVILLLGVNLLTKISQGFISSQSIPDTAKALLGSVDSMMTLVNVGLIIIIIILIPVYLSKRSEQNKTGQDQQTR